MPSRLQMIADRLPEPLLEQVRTARRGLWRLRGRFGREAPGPARPVVREDAAVRALIGPANFAGQAWAWARAAERYLDDVDMTAMSVARGALEFSSDYAVPLSTYRSPSWQRAQQQWVCDTFSHVLIDAMRSPFGSRYGPNAAADLPVLARAGIAVGLIAHGSDIRLGSVHRELYEWSPWKDDTWAHGRRLEEQARRLGTPMRAYDGPTFVSTPDLLDFAPAATWLPVVVDDESWAHDGPLLERDRPIVLHVPSNPQLKGSQFIDMAMQQLHEAGVIEYRRLQGVAPSQMPALVAEADIVIDQVVLGLYSVSAVEGMCAGRVVVAHVADRVRERIGRPLPIAEATPADLQQVIERLVGDRSGSRDLAEQGRAFAKEVHDGRRSAAVLAEFLGRPEPTSP